MLSNVSIEEFLKLGDIVVDPWNEDMMDAARVTFHLGKKILVPAGAAVVDIKNKTIPEYQEVIITDDAPFKLVPGMFVLGETYERIGLSENVGALLDGRSTLARLGLMITQTAAIIDTGQLPKQMTLEIKNNGPHAILLYPKMKFGKLCFFLLDPPATMRHDAGGKYLPGDKHRPIFNNQEIKN